jgi:hypothetical protein
VDATLELDERDRLVQMFRDDLAQLDLVSPTHITPLADKSQDNTRYGLMVKLPEPDRVTTWIKDLSDRLEVTPVEIRLTCTIDRMRVQVQTASPEELLSVLAAVDAILPAQQTFRARAATYAHRGGEITPVEQANLELLRYRLNLNPDVAQRIIDRALGPYADRQAKLNEYRRVLNAELERHPGPLSDTTRAELRRLYESLGLTYADVEPIDREHITQIQAEAEKKRLAEEVTRLQQETQLQAEAEQQQAATQQNYAELYREEFAEAIARTLFPSEFDRGRLEQARRNWSLDGEQVRAIEREVTDEKYGPIDSGLGLDYGRLRQLLWLNQWEAADQETERLILTALSQDMRPLEDNAILKLNCIDLQTLNDLWSRYSHGQFGFAAQHQVYVEAERRTGDFLVSVGWVGAGLGGIELLSRRRAYRDLQFDLEAPTGHLPTWRWTAASLEGDYVVDEDIVHNFFIDLVEKCLPGLKTSIAASDGEPDLS